LTRRISDNEGPSGSADMGRHVDNVASRCNCLLSIVPQYSVMNDLQMLCLLWCSTDNQNDVQVLHLKVAEVVWVKYIFPACHVVKHLGQPVWTTSRSANGSEKGNFKTQPYPNESVAALAPKVVKILPKRVKRIRHYLDKAGRGWSNTNGQAKRANKECLLVVGKLWVRRTASPASLPHKPPKHQEGWSMLVSHRQRSLW
jgi:hypothetical protein